MPLGSETTNGLDTEVINMEELVNKLANLKANRKLFEDRADSAIHQMGYDKRIDELIEELDQQIELRDSIRRPFESEIAKIDEGIEDISSQIVYAWDPSMKKTMKFDVGVITLRTTQSLDIKDPAILLDNLIAHFSTYRVATEFISGFKKTIVRQFISMHPQASSVAELVPKTTVKLETTK